MKTYRKILCVILALLVCLSIAIFAASAEESVDYEMLYKEKIYECLGDKVSMHHNFSCEYAYNDDGSIPQNEEAPDYLLCWISSNVALKDPVYYVIGDYYFRNDYLYIPFGIPYFIYSVNENKCYSLEEAWETKLPNIENVLAMIGKKGNLYIEAFEEYLKPYVSDIDLELNEQWYFYDELYYYESTTGGTIEIPEATPDYVLAKAGTYFASPLLFYDVFGEYIIHGSCGDPYCASYYIYLPESDKIYTLRDAFDANINGIEKVFTDYKLGDLMGDADGDRKLTIKDATYIQKCLANFEGFKLKDEIRGHNLSVADDGTPDPYVCYIEDFNNDDQVNIKDATAIQKRLAKIDI